MPLGSAIAKRCLNDCHGHGFCDPILGLCRCLAAYDGADCRHDEHVTCPNHCSGHGRCSQQGLCYCMPDFEGADCAARVPEPGNYRQGADGVAQADQVAVAAHGMSTEEHAERGRGSSGMQTGGGGQVLEKAEGNVSDLIEEEGSEETEGEELRHTPKGKPAAISAMLPASKPLPATAESNLSNTMGEAKQAVARAHQGLQIGSGSRARQRRHGWAADEGHFPLVQLATWLLLFALAAVFFFGQQKRGPGSRTRKVSTPSDMPPPPERRGGAAGPVQAATSSTHPDVSTARRATEGAGGEVLGVKES